MEVFRKLLSFKAAGALIILLLLLSCGSGNRRYLIPKKKFINFLVDMHIAEAIAIDAPKRADDFIYKIDSASLYGSVFRKHGVTRAMFDSTMLFYSRKPEEFQDIYNAVTAKLKTIEDEVTRLKLAEDKAGEIILWQDNRVLKYPPLEGYKIPIDVPIQGPGLYTINCKVKMLPDEASMYPRMSVYFYRETEDPEGVQIPFHEIRYTLKNGQYKRYSVTKQLDSTNYTHIRGFIFMYSNSDTLFPRHAEVSEISVTKKE